MALVVKDRVQETSTTTGTGTFTLAGAVSGFQSFSAIGNGNTTYYAIVGGSEWEVGLGTYTSSGTTLSRDTVLASSAGGTTKVTFSAGTKNVFVTYPADKSIYDDAAGNVIGLGTPASVTLTNGTGLPISTGVSGLGTGVATFLATPSSANLASAVTDETGTGSLVFATLPTFGSTGIKLSGSTSGTTTIISGAIAGTTTLTLPTTSGTVALTASPTFTGQATIPTINLTGGQITFPATQSTSADANTLDDYEEGTWTPAVTSGYTTPGYGTRAGLYTKIGNVVIFSIFLEVASGTRAASILTISLPITSKNSSGFAGSASWAYATSGVIGSTSTNLPVLYVNSNSTSLLFYDSNGGNFNGTNLAAATPGFYISGAYYTA
jgi:hypothetical protein